MLAIVTRSRVASSYTDCCWSPRRRGYSAGRRPPSPGRLTLVSGSETVQGGSYPWGPNHRMQCQNRNSQSRSVRHSPRASWSRRRSAAKHRLPDDRGVPLPATGRPSDPWVVHPVFSTVQRRQPVLDRAQLLECVERTDRERVRAVDRPLGHVALPDRRLQPPFSRILPEHRQNCVRRSVPRTVGGRAVRWPSTRRYRRPGHGGGPRVRRRLRGVRSGRRTPA